MQNELAKELARETNFINYIDKLIKCAKENTIIVAVNDTPCGSANFTQGLSQKLMQVGFTIPLFNKWRCSYAAVIDSGILMFEGISQTHSIHFECVLNSLKLEVESKCFGVTGGVQGCKILINDKHYAVNMRGINIIVLNKMSGAVLDSVSFDTYSNDIFCRRHTDSPVVENFKIKHPEVTFINPSYPNFPENDLSSNEKFIIENRINYTIIKENADTLKTALNEYLDNPDDIREVLTAPTVYVGTDGARHFYDYTGKYLNFINGHRFTTNQPHNAKRTIYTLGRCSILGVGVRDCGTLASQLQLLLNENASEQGFIVENYGQFLSGFDDEKEILAILETLPLKPGDIVVGFGGIPTDSSRYNKRPHNFGEFFFDNAHHTENCHKIVANEIFNTMKEHNYFKETLQIVENVEVDIAVKNEKQIKYGMTSEQLQALEEYKSVLSNFYTEQFGGMKTPPKIGSIVMNCNPFTLGHRYLIEQCAAKVDFLVVFVVEEDKSYFPFEDRINLVVKGTEHLPNVGIIGSGSFIISTLTFSDYFNKAELQDRVIDSSTDVTLFAREIAPAIHASIRFVGTEPFDRVTRQYNETLSIILPKYGIEFEEISRIEKGGEAISASRVRAALERGDWSAIEHLVPPTTLAYLHDFNILNKEKFNKQ